MWFRGVWPACVPKARKESAKEKQLKEEEKILESVAEGRGINKKFVLFFLNQGITKFRRVAKLFVSHLLALMSVKEMAKGIIYDDPIKTR